jgi:CheY-like chemotaxis protein
MVYGIIKQSGGYIDVVSRPGIGTTFRFYLPQSKDDPAAPTEKKETGEMPLGDETVLLVEDEGALRRMARVYLVMTGYTVLEASDGDEALKLAREHQGPINLLLTDVVMPKLSGSKLYRQLAAMRPELRVLFMSGHPDEVVRDHGVSGPDTPLLQKPFSPEVLARRIREVLGEGLKR